MTDAQKIYEFLAGIGTDHAGRTILDYLDMFDDDLEKIHDYIQWAFPTRTAGQFGAHAPLLSDEALELVHRNDIAQGNYYAMWVKMTVFYMETNHWLVDSDHNHLRITRIIESSAEFINVRTAEMFANTILNRNRDAGSPINQNSITFWLLTLDAAMARSDDPDGAVELNDDGFYVPKQQES